MTSTGTARHVETSQRLGSFAADRRSASPFPPIASYAFISDCEVNALIAPSGNIEWMCAPRPDSPSVFGAILDRGAGGFRIGPTDRAVPVGRRYLPGTMVLETTWQTATGWLVVRDALLIGRWRHTRERSAAYTRVPTDYAAESVLVRTMECISGTTVITVDCEPVPDYGRQPLSWSYTGDDYGSVVGAADGVDLKITLNSDLRIGFEGRRARARLAMRAGERHFVALTWSGATAPASFEEAEEAIDRTADFWRRWLGHGSFPDHEWAPMLQRSALILKGLSYAPTGALLAAATTSLPETPGGERNWDYRYTWIRDSTFMLWGLYTLGFRLGGERLLLLPCRCRRRQHRPPDHVRGRWESLSSKRKFWTTSRATKGRVPSGSGTEPSTSASTTYGDRYWIRCTCTPSPGITCARACGRCWSNRSRPPSTTGAGPTAASGRSEASPGTSPRRRSCAGSPPTEAPAWPTLHGDQERAERWSAAADEMSDEICSRGVDSRGVFVQHYDTEALDASLLLLPLVRFLPVGDPRVRATVLAIADELTEDGLVLRYRVEETDDGLSGEEGTFAICSFWLVSALAEIGELERARALCERLLSYASPLGIYAEEIEPGSGRQLGNFPQAFTHLALINAVMHIIRAESSGERVG